MAQSLSIGLGTVSGVERAHAAGLSGPTSRAWPTRPSRPGCTRQGPRARAPDRLAGLRLPPRRAAQAQRTARAAPPRVPGAASRWVPLHAVLRDLPPLAPAPGPVDAPDSPRRREHPRPARGPQRPRDAAVPGEPARALRATGSSRQCLEQLQALKLTALAAAWSTQPENAELAALSFDERFALLVDAEWRARENKRLGRALRDAKLKLPHASIEAIDYPARRELDKAVIRQLTTCRWVDEHQQVLISGATGVGKTFLACALGNQACRKGYRARYWRASRLYHACALARADGTYGRFLGQLAASTSWYWTIGPSPRSRTPSAATSSNPRGPLRHPRHRRPQPAAPEAVARLRGRPDAGGRDLRSTPPQCPPDRATRTLTEKGGEARQLAADAPVAPLRSRSPIGAFTMERSGCSRWPECAAQAPVRLLRKTRVRRRLTTAKRDQRLTTVVLVSSSRLVSRYRTLAAFNARHIPRAIMGRILLTLA